MIIDRDDQYLYSATPGRRGICRVSLATGRAELLRPRTRKEREMVSDAEWRRAAPEITRMVRAAATEPEPSDDFAPIPPSPWDKRPWSQNITTPPHVSGRPALPDPLGPDYAPIPASIWDRKP